MWVFLNDAFLSIVDKSDQPDCLLVRARDKTHITNVFPGAKVQEGGGTDYQFRAHIPRSEVARVLAERVEAIDYDNFKDSIRDHSLHNACMRVWQSLVNIYGMAGDLWRR